MTPKSKWMTLEHRYTMKFSYSRCC